MENSISTSPINKILKNSRNYAAAKIIPGFLGFLSVIIFTRLLTPADYGLYVLANSTIALVTVIFFEWLNKSILRYFEEYKQKQCLSEFISTVSNSLIGIIIIILTIWSLVVNLLRRYLDSNLIILLNIGTLVILTQAGFTFTLFIRQAAQESFKYAVRSIIRAIAKLVISVCFLYFFHAGPKGILWGITISAGSIFIWEFFAFSRKWEIKISLFSKKLLKNLLSYGLPLIGLSVAALIIVVADRYMIEFFLTTDDVGVYSAGYNLADTIIKFPAAIFLLAAYPIIIEIFEKKDEKETSLLINKIMALYFILLTPMIFGIAVLSKNITYILLGEGFQTSYIILPWVSAGVFCFGLTQYLYKPFELKKKTKNLLYLVISTAILKIILNLFLIPKFGILGGAYSTLISYLFYLFGTWLTSRKIFTWVFPLHTIIKTISASALMYLMLHFVISVQPLNINFLMMDILLGTVCYLVLLWLLREKFILQGSRYVLNYFKIYKK